MTTCQFVGVSFPPPLIISEKVSDFHKNWYEHHATESYRTCVLFSLIPAVNSSMVAH
jgi:hypothetical protein